MGAIARSLTALAAAGLLAACGGGGSNMMNLRNPGSGPDEFAILPTRPLETPADLDALPPPAPGTPNRADPQPEADAVAALGGRPGAGAGADPAVVNYVTRYGVDPSVRARLAAEDQAFRERRGGRLLERVFNVTTYFDAYEAQSLDQYRALEALRRAGIRTPAAPPEPSSGDR